LSSPVQKPLFFPFKEEQLGCMIVLAFKLCRGKACFLFEDLGEIAEAAEAA